MRVLAVLPMGKGLRGLTLRYEHEVLSEAEYFAGSIALPDEMLQIAEHIMQVKTGTSIRPSWRIGIGRRSSRS